MCTFADTSTDPKTSINNNSSFSEKRTLESEETATGTSATATASKKTRFANQVDCSTSEKAVQTSAIFHADKVSEATSVECYVYVSWQSCDRVKKLPPTLLRIGVSLLRGTYKDIAVALWKNCEIRKNIVDLFLKEVNKECDIMCRDRLPSNAPRQKGSSSETTKGTATRDARSVLKKTTKEDMLTFSFEKLDNEMKEKCPLFRSVLLTAASTRKKAQDPHWQAALCTSAAVCLKNRSQRMTALQLYISLIVNTSSYTVHVYYTHS